MDGIRDTETAERITAAPHPGAAKALGREVRGWLGLNLLGFALMETRGRLRAPRQGR